MAPKLRLVSVGVPSGALTTSRGPTVSSDAKPIIHRGVALMLCENEAILEETMLSVDTSKLHIQRIGDRAIVAPAYQLEEIRQALQERGTYPKVIGDLVTPADLEPDEEPSEETEEEEADNGVEEDSK